MHMLIMKILLLYLLYTKLSDEDVEYVIENFKEVVKEYM